MKPAFVIVGASVLPMTRPDARAECIAVVDGRILAVGDEAQVCAAAGADAERVDLPGRAVVPGFIDAHHHLLPSVLYGGSFRLDGARSLSEVFESLRAAAQRVPEGGFLIAHGYDPWKLAERRHPTRDELDATCPEHPALAIEYSFHEGVANTLALARGNLDNAARPPRGGVIGRDRNGRLDGRLAETALYRLEAVAQKEVLARDASRVLADLDGYQDQLFRLGITRVCDAAVSPSLEAFYERALAEGNLRIPVVMMPISADGIGLPPRDRLEGRPTGEGSELLMVGPMKLVLDGASRCAMCLSLLQLLASSAKTLAAAFATRSLSPLRDALALDLRIGRDLRARTGQRYYTPEGATTMVKAAYERGFSVGLHAIGNEAVSQALDAIAAAGRPRGSTPPPRIEHGLAISRDQARRAADLGVCFVLQPDFVRVPSFESLPRPPGLRYVAARTLLDCGALVAGSSDAPAAALDPLDGVRSAAGRKMRSGDVCQPEEAIRVLEALVAYTRDAARACGVAASTGTLEVGKRADLVVLNLDPSASDVAGLENLRVEQTFVGGHRVYPQ